MTEGKVEVFLSYKEPEYRDNLLWLRPYLNKEGYELLYYGSNGWVPLIDCCKGTPTIGGGNNNNNGDNSNNGDNNGDDWNNNQFPDTPELPPSSDSDNDRCPSIDDILGAVDVSSKPDTVVVNRVYSPCNCNNR